MTVAEKIKVFFDSKKGSIDARLFLTRDDGITVYDSLQNETTTSVAALTSGLWQASEALMGLVNKNSDVFEFRLGFDTSEQGIYLVPLKIEGKKYFMGALYVNCLNPGQLKRQVAMLKEALLPMFPEVAPSAKKPQAREGFLFKDISDEEIDRLFAIGGM
jgi:hypothetical protein